MLSFLFHYVNLPKGELFVNLCVSTLIDWGRVTHICVGNLGIIGSDNCLSPGRRHAIIWTDAAGLGFFRKKPISSRSPGKKWKKPISSSFVRTKLEETGQNWKKLWKMSEMLEENTYHTWFLTKDYG